MGVFSTGLLMSISGEANATLLLVLGGIFSLLPALGWATAIVADRQHMDLVQSTKDLTLGFYGFITAEAMTFASFFGYLYYSRFTAKVWPPVGTPHLATDLSGIGTLLLVSSSFTFNWGLHAFQHGKKAVAKNWILFTLALGVVFLGIQGYEWGYLHAYSQFAQDTNVYGSLFYVMTGFHGLHVTVGLLMITMVYIRMERDEIDETHHFSLKAAEYYWHFVDVVWVLLFFSIYLMQ